MIGRKGRENLTGEINNIEPAASPQIVILKEPSLALDTMPRAREVPYRMTSFQRVLGKPEAIA